MTGPVLEHTLLALHICKGVDQPCAAMQVRYMPQQKHCAVKPNASLSSEGSLESGLYEA